MLERLPQHAGLERVNVSSYVGQFRHRTQSAGYTAPSATEIRQTLCEFGICGYSGRQTHSADRVGFEELRVWSQHPQVNGSYAGRGLCVTGGNRVAALTLAPLCLGARGPICRFGFVFGLITGSAEILNLVLENCLPSLARGAFSIAYMLVIFSLWGVAGAFATRRSKSIRVGTAIAATSAALCMLIATAAGFMIELFIRPPDISMVAVWPEFARSGWTDARAFALANTLDSGFTHLLFAPIVAVIFGFFASAMAKRKTQ
jgi:hypothetical protein